jgi:hypothetical protein
MRFVHCESYAKCPAQELPKGVSMKTATAKWIFLMLYYAALAYAQIPPWQVDGTPQREPFLHTDSGMFLNKFGNRMPEMTHFQGQTHPFRWWIPKHSFQELGRNGVLHAEPIPVRRSYVDRWNHLRTIPSSFNPIQTHSFSGGVDTAWVRHYGAGLGTSHDIAIATAVDNAGGVCVTGTSDNHPFGTDVFTIKYDTEGNQIWSARYGAGKGYDHASDIAIDRLGNVYVVGSGHVTNSTAGYITIKYNASGVEQWVAHYARPGNSDDAIAIAVDDSGNVYVTGESIGSDTFFDYATIKYNTSGIEQWIARYNGPGIDNDDIEYAKDLAVDDKGNVYVTGGSFGIGTYFDYATIKYNSSGIEQWVARYNGPGDRTDIAVALVLDGFGGAYVTGRSEGSGTSFDFCTIKYNTAGVVEWIARYNDPRNTPDEATALALDGRGNVYVVGSTFFSGSSYDYTTVKYNTLGFEQWVRGYNGPKDSDDGPHAVAVDGTGNVYVTGAINGIGTNTDYATVKYNVSGDEEWAISYDGPIKSFDYATALAVDRFGNVYVTGESDGEGIDLDYATIKYSTLGLERWVARFGGPGSSADDATALAMDDHGNVYVTGGSSDDYATIKYNPSGTAQWIVRYDGTGHSFDFATAVACDKFGNIYVTGESYGPDGKRDYATIKYNSAGVEQWVARFNGPDNTEVYAVALAVDNAGNVYVTGSSLNAYAA